MPERESAERAGIYTPPDPRVAGDVRGLAGLVREGQRRPLGLAAGALIIGLFVCELSPFDFITGTDGLHGAFRRARLDPAGALSPHVHTTLPTFFTEIAVAVWFAVLGYVSSLAARERGETSVGALCQAIMHGFVLVAVTESLQLLTRSNEFDVSAMLLRMLSVTLGAWCATYVVDELTRSRWRVDRRLVAPTSVLVVLLVMQLGAVVLPQIDREMFRLDMAGASFPWKPLEAFWSLPTRVAAAQVLTSLVTFGTLAATAAVILIRRGVPGAWWLTGLLTTGVAMLVEMMRAVRAEGGADITVVLIAAVSTVVLALFAGWWNRAKAGTVSAATDS